MQKRIHLLKQRYDTVGIAFWDIVTSGVLDHPYWKEYGVAIGTPIIKLFRSDNGTICIKIYANYARIRRQQVSSINDSELIVSWNNILTRLKEKLTYWYPHREFTIQLIPISSDHASR